MTSFRPGMVIVNGVIVGKPHVGGSTAFEYDITEALRNTSEDTVLIKCADHEETWVWFRSMQLHMQRKISNQDEDGDDDDDDEEHQLKPQPQQY